MGCGTCLTCACNAGCGRIAHRRDREPAGEGRGFTFVWCEGRACSERRWSAPAPLWDATAIVCGGHRGCAADRAVATRHGSFVAHVPCMGGSFAAIACIPPFRHARMLGTGALPAPVDAVGWEAPVTTEERAATHGSNRVRARRGSGLLVALMGLAGLLAAAACGSTPRSSPRATPTVTDSASAVPSPSPSGDQTAAIIAAYKAQIAALVQAWTDTSPGAWTLPALPATMANPLLQEVATQLESNELQGIVVRGTLMPQDPKVVSITGTTAVVSDCVWDTTVQYYKATNQPVPNQAGGTQPGGDAYSATLVLVSGKWMVSDETEELKTCAGS